ncbi:MULTISPECIES: glycosyltransferase family 2 protein [unclassified Aureimonas]|uniref:glycosyltransferase family 2 protein n=1 Tax=unclassified Aureimonas TaxID=2615206 RepID=UPI0006FDCA5E|nr:MULTISPECIES: glycosyltransferase [unclassified Aureimonas]KQT60476.1 hypothetical protein ASG62_07455 [Aureimonas sp. Leaf427]KQT79353.1 hypothetical protein ASG54_10055 [Aureimonas sp. Leaf460]
MSKSVEGHPLVAIVTPVYNGAAFLEKAMLSVQSQTYPNIVHIVLNNASTDGSAEIIEKFRDARVEVRVFENETVLPLQQNWNKAFSKVPDDARYVKLACADDLARPDAIAKMVALAETDESIEVVLCDDVFDDKVRRSWLPRSKSVHDGKHVARRILEGTFGWFPFHHFFVRMHPEFRGESFCGEVWAPDPYVVMRSAVRGRVGYVPEPLVYTRVHADSVTGKELKVSVRNYLVPFNLWKEFGSAVYGTDERRVFPARYRRSMARMYLIMRLRKQGQQAKLLWDELYRAGETLPLSTFATMFARYPLHFLRKSLKDKPGRAPMNESDFIGQTHKPA